MKEKSKGMKGIKERRRGGGVKDKDTEEIIIG
jgi:hypothetical protein